MYNASVHVRICSCLCVRQAALDCMPVHVHGVFGARPCTVQGLVMWTSLVPLPLVVVVMMYCVVAC